MCCLKNETLLFPHIQLHFLIVFFFLDPNRKLWWKSKIIKTDPQCCFYPHSPHIHFFYILLFIFTLLRLHTVRGEGPRYSTCRKWGTSKHICTKRPAIFLLWQPVPRKDIIRIRHYRFYRQSRVIFHPDCVYYKINWMDSVNKGVVKKITMGRCCKWYRVETSHIKPFSSCLCLEPFVFPLFSEIRCPLSATTSRLAANCFWLLSTLSLAKQGKMAGKMKVS